MRRELILLPAIAILSFGCQPAEAGATLTNEFPVAIKLQIKNATMIYYEIDGSAANELRLEMNRLGPLDPTDGLRYDARTDWHISWTWPGYAKRECDLSRAHVSYDIKVTAPYWEPPSETEPELIVHWNEYMNALALHEQVHVDLIVNHYLEVKDAIQRSTCETAGQAAQEVLEEFRRRDEEYDQQTRHGETQGAVFP